MKLPGQGHESSTRSSPIQMQKNPSRTLSLLLYFLPTSLFLLLVCNGFFFFFTTGPLIPTHLPIRETTMPRSPVLAVVKEEDSPLPQLKTYQKLKILPATRLSWSRRTRSGPRYLRPNDRSRRFSTRADEFFNGSSCHARFFMTWISSLESFSDRELFAMESLFKTHPSACLLLLSDTMDSTKGSQLLKPFSDKGFRASAMSPDYYYLFKNTPAQSWFQRLLKGKVDSGEVSLGQNLSNLLRLAALYKYGGVYIDTDVIVLKSFSSLKNAIGAQSINTATGNWSRLNNAVMVFDKKHPLLYKFIEEFALTFDGNKWGHNGPYLVSRVVARVMGRLGFEFSVLPPLAFYPVDWSRVRGLFRGPRGRGHSKWVEAKLWRIREESFAIHLWNRQSSRIKVEEGSIIGQIMSDCSFCNSSSF